MSDTAEMTTTKDVALIPQRELVPADVFRPGGVDALLNEIATRARAERPDPATLAGRKQIASLAAKVARSKTFLDDMGKKLVEDWKRSAGRVDQERRRVRDFLDALKDEVRGPLTEYEQREARRVAAHEDAIEAIRENPEFYKVPQPSADLARRLEYLRAYPERDWQEFERRAAETIAMEIEFAEQALAAALTREAQEAEMARLRAQVEQAQREAAERDRAEREARLVAQAEERARREAEERAAAQVRDAERRAAAEVGAAEQRARQAEAARLAAVEQERKRVAAARAAEQAEAERRLRDRDHQAKVNNSILNALVGHGIDGDVAREVIALIARGEIPRVSISY